jgi:hypothetical protein
MSEQYKCAEHQKAADNHQLGPLMQISTREAGKNAAVEEDKADFGEGDQQGKERLLGSYMIGSKTEMASTLA